MVNSIGIVWKYFSFCLEVLCGITVTAATLTVKWTSRISFETEYF